MPDILNPVAGFNLTASRGDGSNSGYMLIKGGCFLPMMVTSFSTILLHKEKPRLHPTGCHPCQRRCLHSAASAQPASSASKRTA